MDGMIFAAGLGTRLRPLTNDRPKALVTLGGQTLLERTIVRLKAAGVERVVVNVHHFGEQIVSFLEEHDHFGMDIRVSDERQQLLDTGGGLLKARELFHPGAAVLVHNVDILTDVDLRALAAWHEQHGAYATLVVQPTAADRVLRFNARDCLTGWENRRTGEQKVVSDDFYGSRALGFCGIQILSADFLQHIGHGGTFSIIDELLLQARAHAIHGYLHPGLCLDLGTPVALRQAERLPVVAAGA